MVIGIGEKFCFYIFILFNFFIRNYKFHLVSDPSKNLFPIEIMMSPEKK